MSNSKINVTIHIEGGQGELEIIDGTFQTIDRGFGTLKAMLNPGIYKTRARVGDIQHEELFLVAPEAAPITIKIEPLNFATPVPLQGTSTSHEYHQDVFYVATASTPVDFGLGQGAELLLFLRDPSDANFTQRNAPPEIKENYRRSFDGFRLSDADGNFLLNFDDASKCDPDWGYAISRIQLKPGYYVLSYEPLNGKHVAMPIQLVQSWQTQICILVNFPNGLEASGHPNLPDRAIMMAPVGIQFNPSDDRIRLIEIARYAFMDRSSITTNELINELPQRKLDNPILELLYAHQLLMEKQPDIGLLKMLVDRLTQMLGADFPDVLALSLVLDHLNGIKPEPINEPPFPPLLRASWRILAHYPELFPSDSLLCKAAAHLVSRGVWFAWKPIESRSEEYLASLLAGVGSLPSADVFSNLAQQLPLDAIFNHLKAKVATRDLQDDVSVAHSVIVMLAQTLPWETLFSHISIGLKERDLMADFTNLQKSLLPTLQLIHEQLKEGGDFPIEEFKQLLAGLHVPLPVLYESLMDLATKTKKGRRVEVDIAQPAITRQADGEAGLTS